MRMIYGYLAVAGWVWVAVLAVILYRQLRRKPPPDTGESSATHEQQP